MPFVALYGKTGPVIGFEFEDDYSSYQLRAG